MKGQIIITFIGNEVTLSVEGLRTAHDTIVLLEKVKLELIKKSTENLIIKLPAE